MITVNILSCWFALCCFPFQICKQIYLLLSHLLQLHDIPLLDELSVINHYLLSKVSCKVGIGLKRSASRSVVQLDELK